MGWFLPHPLALVTLDRLLKLTRFHICKVAGRELILSTKRGSSWCSFWCLMPTPEAFRLWVPSKMTIVWMGSRGGEDQGR